MSRKSAEKSRRRHNRQAKKARRVATIGPLKKQALLYFVRHLSQGVLDDCKRLRHGEAVVMWPVEGQFTKATGKVQLTCDAMVVPGSDLYDHPERFADCTILAGIVDVTAAQRTEEGPWHSMLFLGDRYPDFQGIIGTVEVSVPVDGGEVIVHEVSDPDRALMSVLLSGQAGDA